MFDARVLLRILSHSVTTLKLRPISNAGKLYLAALHSIAMPLNASLIIWSSRLA